MNGFINIELDLAGDIYFEDINLEKSYAPIKSYGQSKLANVLFTKELAHRLKGKNINQTNKKLVE